LPVRNFGQSDFPDGGFTATEAQISPARELPFRMPDDAHLLLPVPDPTKLTTDQLNREIGGLKEIIFTRLDGMDRAIVLFNENLNRIPSDTDNQTARLKELLEARSKAVDEKIAALREIQDEKFESIQMQFKERDVRTEQSSKDSKVAVDAALQAAKEAVGAQNSSSALAIAKSEMSTVKQIDQLSLLIQTSAKAVDDKFSDVKDRLTRIEGKEQGASTTIATQQTSNGTMIAIISAVIALAAVVVAILGAVKH
jgi:phage I-like protein